MAGKVKAGGRIMNEARLTKNRTDSMELEIAKRWESVGFAD